MSEFAARIGRVRFKNGGAELRIINNAKAEAGEEDHRGALVKNARSVAEMGKADDPLVGYVLVGLFASGGSSVGWRYDFDAISAIPRMLVPAWIAEIIRRDIISGVEARDVFSNMFEWRE
jgi:hypothetical protein